MDKYPNLSLAVTVFAMVGTMIELEPLHADSAGARVISVSLEPEIVPLPEKLRPQEGTPMPLTEPKKEATKTELMLTPAEAQTPEQAAMRAADPKSATGALIVAPKLKK